MLYSVELRSRFCFAVANIRSIISIYNL